jgi:hypothetical protein
MTKKCFRELGERHSCELAIYLPRTSKIVPSHFVLGDRAALPHSAAVTWGRRPARHGGVGLHVTMEQVSSLLEGIQMSFSPVSRPARSAEPSRGAPSVPHPPGDPRPPSFHAPHHFVLAADPGHRLAGRSTGTPRPKSSRHRENFTSDRRVQAEAGTAVGTPRQLQAASPSTRSVETCAATGLVHF